MTMRTFHSAALGYASLGWRVYPIEPGGKRPLYKAWIEQASVDPGLIGQWWRDDAGAPNVGLVCGEAFDVFDVEAVHVPAFRALADRHGLPLTPVARSGRGGVHVYALPLSLGTRNLILDGVHIGELKGSGGVVVPPSVTTGGYAWLRQPWAVPIAAAPAWLRALVPDTEPARSQLVGPLSPSRAVALAHGLFRVIAEASDGQRNSMLFWASCRAAEHGLERTAAEEILLAAALRAGLPEREARSTIASGFDR